jgi:hypothetical protein
MPYLADELLSKSKMDLKAIRARLFLGSKFRGNSEEFHQALLDFCVMMSLVQDLIDWRRHSEPGLAARMMHVDHDEKSIEQARWIDRRSITMHSEISEEFEKLGGREEFQRRIEILNDRAAAEGLEGLPKPSGSEWESLGDPEFDDLGDDVED